MDYGDERLPERFWDKVFPEPNTGCWLWGGGSGPRNRYGQFKIGPKTYRPSRLVLSAKTGDPGVGRYALHSCDVPLCVNPDHLRWGDQRDNMLDAKSRGRLRSPNGEKTHCRAGHEYSQENTRVDKKGARHCRTCQKAQTYRWRSDNPDRWGEIQRTSWHRRKAAQ